MIRATMAILALTLALPGTHAMAQDRSLVCDKQMDVAFDAMIDTLFEFSDRLADESGLIGISMASILVWIIGGLMAAAAIIVISLGKIGLAMAIALAPFFIPTLMFKATSNLFESWVRFTLGFAMIPLVMAGVIGAIVGIGQGMITDAAGASKLADAAGFVIVGVGAVFLTMQVPTLVNSLSGTITATANGMAMTMSAAGMGAALGRCGRHGGERFQEPCGSGSLSLGATRGSASWP